MANHLPQSSIRDPHNTPHQSQKNLDKNFKRSFCTSKQILSSKIVFYIHFWKCHEQGFPLKLLKILEIVIFFLWFSEVLWGFAPVCFVFVYFDLDFAAKWMWKMKCGHIAQITQKSIKRTRPKLVCMIISLYGNEHLFLMITLFFCFQ